MADGARPARPRSLEGIVSSLSADSYYQSPGGRRFLVASALLADLPAGARVLDVESGIGSGAVDLAEAFNAKVTAFDNYAPYLAFGRQNAVARGVGKAVAFKSLDGPGALNTIETSAYDLVLGLGGALTDVVPGGLEGGFKAAALWCRPGGHLVAGELVTPASPSHLMKYVFGDGLRSETDFLGALAGAGFELVFSSRATSADWDEMRTTMAKLRDRSLDLGPPDERQRQGLTEAARNHPEIAYLNVLARKR